jgi:hypothetical protein
MLPLIFHLRERSLAPILPTLFSTHTPHKGLLYDQFFVIIDFITFLNIIATCSNLSIQPMTKTCNHSHSGQKQKRQDGESQSHQGQSSHDKGLRED